MTLSRTVVPAALAVALAGCGGAGPTRNIEKPFTGWIEVAGMRCGDGSPTGIGISGGRSDAVLVFLSFGGACWSATSCNAEFARFGESDYALFQLLSSGTIFDRTLAGNPFASWTYVFVPYCTGDVHAGDAVQAYGGLAGTWDHHGWKNLQAAVRAFTADLPRPAHLVVAGSSAGGFGAVAGYDLVRDAWDPAGGTTAGLLDDSGPTFVGTAIPGPLLSAWWDAWGLGSTLGAGCPECRTDLSAMWDRLHARHPDDRLALLSTTQDGTMRGFFADAALGVPQQTPLEFQANVDALAQKLSGLGVRVASDRVGGANAQQHALLVRSSFFASDQGPGGLAWISQLASLDPAWTSTTQP